MSESAATNDFDAIVIGAGFSGLYALHRLREAGLKVRVFEAADAVGGTWYWNRYPGARTDSQSAVYQYWFSDELLAEWDWSERFPAQEETERYLNFVADRFDLRQDIRFGTRVSAADYDEGTGRWHVTTADGDDYDAQFLVMATGGLTETILPDIPGRDSFAGASYHTARWPKAPVDFRGKRVGVIGTGATGIQVIQTIAPEVEQLTVFQRTPNYTIPMRNPRLDDDARARYREHYPETRERVRHTFAGFADDFDARPYAEIPPAERLEILERLWADGSLAFWIGGFRELFSDETVNAEVSAFVREKIRGRIDDPAVAEKLIPTDYGFGTRRVPLETNYYEAYNRDNVTLVDLRAEPIVGMTADGVTTSAGEYPLDIMVYATGFDAGMGALTHVDIRGRDGQLVREAWADGIRSFMGLQIHGYPNMFMVMAPMSPAAAFCNVPTCIQEQIDWITDTCLHVRDRGQRSIEPSAEAEARWGEHHDEVANMTLVPKTKSWYMGSNVEGKPKRLLAYAGGAGVYHDLCDEVKAKGYREFEFA